MRHESLGAIGTGSGVVIELTGRPTHNDIVIGQGKVAAGTNFVFRVNGNVGEDLRKKKDAIE